MGFKGILWYIYIYVYPQPPGFAVNTILSSHLALCKDRCDRYRLCFSGAKYCRRCRVVVVMTFIRLRSFKCFFPRGRAHIITYHAYHQILSQMS